METIEADLGSIGEQNGGVFYGKRCRQSDEEITPHSSCEEALVEAAISEATTARDHVREARMGLSESVDMAYINSLLSLCSFPPMRREREEQDDDVCLREDEKQAQELEERIKEWTKVQRAARALQRAFRKNVETVRAARLIQRRFRLRKRRSLRGPQEASREDSPFEEADLADESSVSRIEADETDEGREKNREGSPMQCETSVEATEALRPLKQRSNRRWVSTGKRSSVTPLLTSEMEDLEHIEAAARSLQRYLRNRLKRIKAAIRIQRAYREKYIVVNEIASADGTRRMDEAASAVQRAFRSHYNLRRQKAAACIQKSYRKMKSNRSRRDSVERMALRQSTKELQSSADIRKEEETIKFAMEEAISAMESLEKSSLMRESTECATVFSDETGAGDEPWSRGQESPASASAAADDTEDEDFLASEAEAGSDMDGAALRIQTKFRSWAHRRRFIKMRGATVRMQTIFRGRSFMRQSQTQSRETLCCPQGEDLQKVTFQPLSLEESQNALGTFSTIERDEEILFRSYQSVCPCLSAPREDEWLSICPEKEQTVDDFAALIAERWKYRQAHKASADVSTLTSMTLPVLFSPSVPSRPTRACGPFVYVAPVGLHDKVQQEAMKAACDYLQRFLQATVLLVASLPLRAKVRARPSPDEGRPQLCAPDMIRGIGKIVPTDATGVVVITSHDLYPSESWNYVFGAASGSLRTAVVSCARLGSERDFLTKRLCRLLTHETLHVLGFRHCVYHPCLMNGSSGLREADRRPSELCPVCLRKLSLTLSHSTSSDGCSMNVAKCVPKRETLEKRFSELREFVSSRQEWGEEHQIWSGLLDMSARNSSLNTCFGRPSC